MNRSTVTGADRSDKLDAKVRIGMFSKRKANSRPSDGERALEPILVDYFTRDGSTLMMRLLATSPNIAVGGKYPYEHKYFAYLYRWCRLLDRRQWPRDFWTGAHLASLTQEEVMPFMGPPPWLRRELFEPRRGDEEMSEYAFRTVWEEFSRRAAAQTREQHKAPGAEVRYYAEKHMTSWKVSLDHLPSVRLAALLRDPRDTYVSITAFTKKRQEAGDQGFVMGRVPGESSEVWLARYLERQRERLRWIQQAMKNGTTPVFRYEDMVLDLPGQARRIEDWLGVSLDTAAVSKDEKLPSHVSASTPESSIGRWQTEMPAELARQFHDVLGEELKALGFDVPTPQRPPPEPAVVAAERGDQGVATALDGERESREGPAFGTTQEERISDGGGVQVAEEDQPEPGEALNEDRDRLRAQLEAAAIEKAQLQGKLNETERWLRGLERSRSWRMTRPIRAAGAAFRKLAQRRTAPPRQRV